jgi:hypothetical protein
MKPKIFAALAALLFFSGCCRFFGVCTSASVHTSISSPTKVGQTDAAHQARVAAVTPDAPR